MEDRHTLSEPRAITGLALPTWEVDVFREGVDTPIMTIVLDNKTLPPRKRKKKVVWKLPDSLDLAPKFGVEDKKRILEIFKERKKELRKQRKSSLIGGGGSESGEFDDEEAEEAAMAAEAATHNAKIADTVVPSPPPGMIPIISTTPTVRKETERELSRSNGSTAADFKSKTPPRQPPGLVQRSTSIAAAASDMDKATKTTANNCGTQPKPPVSSPPPGFPAQTKKTSKPAAEQYRRRKTQPSPPASGPSALETRANGPPYQKQDPPTIEPNIQSSTSPVEPTSAPQLSATDAALDYPQQRQQEFSSAGGPPGAPPRSNPNLPQQPHLHPASQEPLGTGDPHRAPPVLGRDAPSASLPLGARQFTVPLNSTLAQVAAESYYMLLANGMVEMLASYYSPTAQKSCTVGGAHAVCREPEDREQQLRSLVGMVVQIKGLLQQPTAGQATLVLITGTCLQPHALPFCHSIVLIPTSHDTTNVGYQIQNDALCFLTDL
jgi:hypothetical protein